MKRASRVPRFKSDREAADFWATHDSTRYVTELKRAELKLSPALRRRVKARAVARKKR